MMIRYLTIYKRLRRKVHNLEIQNSVFQDVIENARQYAEELERQNQALKDALKKATAEPEVDYWKTVLDDDIDKYILKEGEDERD
jgi:translation initiation factor 2 beta subunit (eIF-2beta)/eIF-5